MLNGISWYDYTSTIIALTVFYYTFVVVKYYRHDLLYAFARKDEVPVIAKPPVNENIETEIDAFIAQAGREGMEEGRLLTGLRNICSKVPMLGLPEVKDDVKRYLRGKSKVHCKFELSDEMLETVFHQS